MRIYGSRVRDTCVITFDLAILIAFPCHKVQSPWFWGGLAVVLGLTSLVIIGLELTRLLAPGFTDNWWGPD